MAAVTGTARPIGILVAALGGEGGGVLAEWLVGAATQAGFIAQSTSIPGVAQRTGATTYYVEIHPERIVAPGGRRPVLSLLPVPGAVDLLVASELLEAVRIASAGLPSRSRSTVIASTHRTLTTAEKMALGDGRFDSDRLLRVLREQSKSVVTFDMEAIAREAGTVVSAVMFGAIAGSESLPFGREACEAVIRESGIGVEASLRGFAAGAAAVRSPLAARQVDQTAADGDGSRAPEASRRAAELFPEPVRRFVAIGHARLAEYQDDHYAAMYVERLKTVAAAEANADPRGAHHHALLNEAARFLALWMAFDDIVRVAQLKSAAGRAARVRREVRAGADDVVRIIDYFKPGMPEIAGMFPPVLARPLLAWDARRQRRGKRAFGMALHLRSDGVFGHAALRALAALRARRPRSARFLEEQRAIGAWLEAITAGVREDWTVGWEIARCGRLIKGYGATNERGKRNLAHIIAHLGSGGGFATAADRARAIAAAREAALADEGGNTLDRTLAAYGAPPRPIMPKPVVWHPSGRRRQEAVTRSRPPESAK